MTIEERVAALETWSGQHAEWIVDYGERIAALERVGQRVSGMPDLNGIAERFLGAVPNVTSMDGSEPLPSRNPIGAETRTDTRATRLAEIESELAALALRRGALVGERERLRGAP